MVLRHQELVKSSLSTCADEVDNLVSNNTSPTSGKGNLLRGIVDCSGVAQFLFSNNFSLFQEKKPKNARNVWSSLRKYVTSAISIRFVSL